MRSTPRRRSEASSSRRSDPGSSTRRGSAMGSRSSHTRPPLVNTSGRSPAGRVRSSRPTSSSECPRPYTAAVSIQLIPSSSARRIAASELASSCGPQPNDQPPPPKAQAPKPTVVISSPLVPSGRVGSVMPGPPLSRNQQHLARGLPPFERAVRRGRLRERELAADAQLQRARADPAEHLLGARQQLGPRRHVVRETRPREEQRALLAEQLRIERADRPARLPEQHQHAPRGETVQALGEGGLAH